MFVVSAGNNNAADDDGGDVDNASIIDAVYICTRLDTRTLYESIITSVEDDYLPTYSDR